MIHWRARIFAAACLLAVARLPAPARQTGPYRIAGTIVDASTGEPVRGAMVAVLAAADGGTVASTESDDDGHFALENLPAGKFPLTASKRGYCTGFYDQHGDFNSAIVTGEGQETGHLVFRLTPGAVLSGVVADDGGDAVEGATVMLFAKPRGHEPGARIAQAGAAVTDDTGAYEFAGLAAGEYLLAVSAKPWYAINPRISGARQETEAQAALDVAYPVTFFDSTTDEGSATPVELAGGSRQQANFSLYAVPALHLDVETPRKPDGSLAPAILEQTVFDVEVPGAEDEDSRDGRTEFSGVAPGNYTLTQGDPPRVAALDVTQSQQVDPDAGAAAAVVTGILQMPSGAASAEQAPDRIIVTLDPVDASGQLPLSAYFSRNTFRFPAVPAGTYNLRVLGSKMAVISVIAGGRRLAGSRVTVRDQPLSLVVAMSANPARIEGFVHKDGKGLAGAMVVLVPKDLAAIPERSRRDQSDSDGSFALINVAPGEYTVVAIEDGWQIDWSSPAVIARYLPGGVAVPVGNGSGNLIHLSGPVPVQGR